MSQVEYDFPYLIDCKYCGQPIPACVMHRGSSGFLAHGEHKDCPKSPAPGLVQAPGTTVCIDYKDKIRINPDRKPKTSERSEPLVIGDRLPKKYRGGGRRYNADSYEARIHTSERSYNSQGRSLFSYRYKRYRL